MIPQLPMGELRILLDAMELVCDMASDDNCLHEDMRCEPVDTGECSGCRKLKARTIAAALEAL